MKQNKVWPIAIIVISVIIACIAGFWGYRTHESNKQISIAKNSLVPEVYAEYTGETLVNKIFSIENDNIEIKPEEIKWAAGHTERGPIVKAVYKNDDIELPVNKRGDSIDWDKMRINGRHKTNWLDFYDKEKNEFFTDILQKYAGPLGKISIEKANSDGFYALVIHRQDQVFGGAHYLYDAKYKDVITVMPERREYNGVWILNLGFFDKDYKTADLNLGFWSGQMHYIPVYFSLSSSGLDETRITSALGGSPSHYQAPVKDERVIHHTKLFYELAR